MIFRTEIRSPWSRLLMLAAIAVFPLGCGSDETVAPNDPGGGSQGEETIVGADGGTVATADGRFTLVIPAGAVAADTTITLTAGPTHPAHSGFMPGTAYEVGPVALAFDENAELTMAYDLNDIPVGANRSSLSICKAVAGEWLPLPTSPSWSEPTLSAFVDQLGLYGVVATLPVDACTNYPTPITTMAELEALRGCTSVIDIRISGDEITSLDALADLEWAYTFYIVDCPNLQRIGGDGKRSDAGLSSLKEVFSLTIVNNGALETIDLPALERIATTCNIQGNDALTSISMDALLAAGNHRADQFLIRDNAALQSLSMTSLARIGGLFRIQDNPELDSLGNYPDLQEVHGTFSVMECGITALGTFPRLERVKSFTLFRCHLLTSLSGANLGYVEESVEIRENSGLTTLSGLQATIGGNLAIRQNIGLSDLVGMSVPSVGHSVQIWNNGGLTSLNGLSSIGDMGSLGIEYCGQLVDLQGIGTLPPYMDAVYVANNPLLESLSGLGTLMQVGGLTIESNPVLASLEGLNNLTSTDSQFQLFDNPQLHDISALSSLSAVRSLYIEYCHDIQNLDALSNLRRLGWNTGTSGGGLKLQYNLHLCNIEGLHNLTVDPGTGYAISGNLTITGFMCLLATQAWDFVEAIGGESVIGGEISIYEFK